MQQSLLHALPLFSVMLHWRTKGGGYVFKFLNASKVLVICFRFISVSINALLSFHRGTQFSTLRCLASTHKVTTEQEWEESGSKRQNGLCRFKQEGNRRSGKKINNNIKLI